MQSKNLSASFTKLVKILSDGQCHTGTMLGKQLNISRNAVWKHIQQLLDYGIKLEAQHQGYTLKQSLILLNAVEITNNIHYRGAATIAPVMVLGDVGSTNDYLKQEMRPDPTQLQFCLAERQLAGRGRFGRVWHSPFAANIYLSCRWHFSGDMGKLGGLSLVVGLAVINTMRKLGVSGMVLKWPNDILWQQQKLAGVLIEIRGEIHGQTEIIIGVGINTNMTENENTGIKRAWTSLAKILQMYLDRNKVAGLLITSIAEVLDKFVVEGFAPFQAEWAAHDYLFGQEIILHNGSAEIKGQAQGVNQEACLMLKKEDGSVQAYSAGEVSLSPLYTHSI